MPGALDSELEQAHSHVVASLAGIEAERLFCDELLAHTGHDLQAARAVAALIVREVSDVDSYINRARIETRALLTAHAASVLAIADALVERRTLSRSQIYRVITRRLTLGFPPVIVLA
jgi:hypothetical protein